MISLVEFCKIVTGYIFGASDYQLKRLLNILILQFSSLKYHHRHSQIIQFWCAYGSDSEENKEELIKVEAMSINVYVSSCDEDISSIDFIII